MSLNIIPMLQLNKCQLMLPSGSVYWRASMLSCCELSSCYHLQLSSTSRLCQVVNVLHRQWFFGGFHLAYKLSGYAAQPHRRRRRRNLYLAQKLRGLMPSAVRVNYLTSMPANHSQSTERHL